MTKLIFESRPVIRTAWVVALALGALISCQPPAGSSRADTAAPAAVNREQSRLNNGPVRDLSQDERTGGHILRKHVGQTEEQLRARLQREENNNGASPHTARPTP